MPANGGDQKVEFNPEDFIAVFLGKDGKPVQEFAEHPRIAWIPSESGQDALKVVARIPPTTKIFILSEGIPSPIYQMICTEARRKKGLYLNRKNDHAIRGSLREFLNDPKLAEGNGNGNGKPGKPIAGRGDIQRLLDKHLDIRGGSTEEARRIAEIAKTEGIATTVASLVTAISIRKRKAGAGEIPKSAKAPDPKGDGLQLLNDTIAQLELLRDWIVSTDAKNKANEEMLSVIQKAFAKTES